jgi:putative ATP-dependent endonuclease of OLD family
MKIDSLAIRGFRCFPPHGPTIRLDDMTTFVGPNSSGKTAAMMALARLFGESPGQRHVTPSDFYLAPNEALKQMATRTLSIECRLAFPELDEPSMPTGRAVPETFNQMVVGSPGGTPFCRMRLEATWTDDGTAYGDVEQELVWILTDSDDPNIINDGHRRKVQPADRARIRVLYVPAMRDPDHQIRGTTATVFGRLLDALAWNGVDATMTAQLKELHKHLTSLTGIQTLNAHVQATWGKIYLGRVARNVTFQAVEEDPAALVKLLTAAFQPSEDGRMLGTSDLSDGLRSLFALSLSLGLFAVERTICQTAEEAGFTPEIVNSLPLLTVFAVEEPENHLSPQYLGHIVTRLAELSAGDYAQVLLSSHSPAILARVQPDDVRYFRGNDHLPSTTVVELALPEDGTDEAFKYVREAIRGHPELYFANLVILGEGPSEEIVLKRTFEANGTPLDSRFISLVPLGGRHVNHFWRLLHGLGVPYLTLLDLDREKEGAGWGRVQYVRDQLVALHGAASARLQFEPNGGGTASLADATYDSLSANSPGNTADMAPWINFFQECHDIFFSQPLDLDLSLLEAFPDTYKALIVPPQRGPQLPAEGSPQYLTAVDARVKQVLAADFMTAEHALGNTYSLQQRALFPWYKYFFVDGSKPVTHMRAMIAIDDDTLRAGLPPVLKALIERASLLVAPPTPTEENASH